MCHSPTTHNPIRAAASNKRAGVCPGRSAGSAGPRTRYQPTLGRRRSITAPIGCRNVGAALFFLLGAAGCGILTPGVEHYTIRVDSIVAPAAAGSTDTVAVRFLGMVGPSGCYGLREVLTARSPALFRIEFRGEHRNAVCTQEPVPLDHTATLLPPFADPLRISAMQPSGPALIATIRIE